MAMTLANPSTSGDKTTYDATSVYNGPGTSVLRVAVPSAPAGGQPHRFLHILPVKPLSDVTFGDGFDEVVDAGLHNTYNLTCIAITTPTEPWIGDNPLNTNQRYESFLTLDVVPYCAAHFASSGTEEHWLLSFSKGGYSALTLFFRNRSIFAAAACWDAPIDQVYNAGVGWEMDEAYGSQAAFEANYSLALKLSSWLTGDVLTTSRLWLSGDTVTFIAIPTYQADMQGLRDDLIAAGARFWYKDGDTRTHLWSQGWIPEALAGLAQLYLGRQQALSGMPSTTTGLNASSGYATSLEIALLFQGANGNHLYNAGAAGALGTPRLPNTTMLYANNGVIPILDQAVGDGLNFGTAYAGLDQVDKTIIVWCRPDVLNAYQGLLGKDFDNGGGDDGGWAFLLTDAGRLLWHADAGKDLTDDGAVTLSAATWYMLAVTWTLSTKTARFYINGVLNSTKTDATIAEASSGTAQLLLGKIRDQALFPFDGAYSQVRAYSRVLTAAELAILAVFPYAGYVGQAEGLSRAGVAARRQVWGRLYGLGLWGPP